MVSKAVTRLQALTNHEEYSTNDAPPSSCSCYTGRNRPHDNCHNKSYHPICNSECLFACFKYIRMMMVSSQFKITTKQSTVCNTPCAALN